MYLNKTKDQLWSLNAVQPKVCYVCNGVVGKGEPFGLGTSAPSWGTHPQAWEPPQTRKALARESLGLGAPGLWTPLLG